MIGRGTTERIRAGLLGCIAGVVLSLAAFGVGAWLAGPPPVRVFFSGADCSGANWPHRLFRQPSAGTPPRTVRES